MQPLRVATLLASIAILAACGSAPPPEAAAPPTTTSPQGAAVSPADPAPAASPDVSGPPSASASAVAAPDSGGAATAAPGGATADKTAVEKNPLTGKISQQTIMDLVMKHQELFNDCYTIGAAGSKQFVAIVTVKLSIGPTGVVNATQITKSTAKNPKVDKCVADAFKKMPFPSTGSTVPITFPMHFDGAEQVSQ